MIRLRNRILFVPVFSSGYILEGATCYMLVAYLSALQ